MNIQHVALGAINVIQTHRLGTLAGRNVGAVALVVAKDLRYAMPLVF